MKPDREEIIKAVKKQLAQQFLSEMNEYNYKRLNDFCVKEETTTFLIKGGRFVMFPNDYTFDDHDFFDVTGKFNHMYKNNSENVDSN